MSDAKTVNLCSRCCEVASFPPDVKKICSVKCTEVHSDKPWSEGQNPHNVCKSYRGPLGYDWDEWKRRFFGAFVREARKALDEGTLRPSGIMRAFG